MARGFSIYACIFASLFATAARAEDCTLKLMASFDLDPARRMVLLPVTIGEAKKFMIVDTGAPFSTITREAAHELGLSIYTSRNIRARFANGKESDDQVDIPLLVFARIGMEHVHPMVMPEGTRFPSEDIIGLAGADILYNFDLELDFAGNKLNFFSPDHCKGAGVYWQNDAIAAMSMNLYRRHIAFRMTLDGTEVNTMLDTGSANTVLMQPVASRVFGITENTPGVEKTNNDPKFPIYRYQFNELSMEGIAIKNPVIYLMPDKISGFLESGPATGTHLRAPENQPKDLVLGMNILSKLHFYIAYKERRIYATAATAPAKNSTSGN